MAIGIGISYGGWIGFDCVAAIDSTNCAGDLRFSNIDGNTMVSIVLHANNISTDSQASLCEVLMHPLLNKIGLERKKNYVTTKT